MINLIFQTEDYQAHHAPFYPLSQARSEGLFPYFQPLDRDWIIRATNNHKTHSR